MIRTADCRNRVIRRKSRAHARCFTLVELIATMTILSVVTTSVAFILFTAIDGYAAGSVQADLHRRASVAMERITREIRNIPLDSFATVIAPDIDNLQIDQIDWATTKTIERLGTTISINTADGLRLLLEDVADFTLTAYDESRVIVPLPTVGAACDVIRRIQIEITLSKNSETAYVRSMVHIRSTMSGAVIN